MGPHVACRASAARRLGPRIPRELRELRGKMMLEAEYEFLGVEEVTCPACNGCGRLTEDVLDFCPLCCGFREVPDRLARWFRIHAARMDRASRQSGKREAAPATLSGNRRPFG